MAPGPDSRRANTRHFPLHGPPSAYMEDFTMSTPVFEKDLTGLLVVDPYNDFISEGGILWPLVKEIAEAVHCVPNMLAILQAARAAGVRVFFAPHHRDRGARMKSRAGSTSHRFRTSATNDVSLKLELGAEHFATNSRRYPAKLLRRNTGAPAASQTPTWISSLRSLVSTG